LRVKGLLQTSLNWIFLKRLAHLPVLCNRAELFGNGPMLDMPLLKPRWTKYTNRELFALPATFTHTHHLCTPQQLSIVSKSRYTNRANLFTDLHLHVTMLYIFTTWSLIYDKKQLTECFFFVQSYVSIKLPCILSCQQTQPRDQVI